MKETYEALIKGIQDYCKKHNFSKAIIGISGGIDSAITSILAVKALGKANVMGVALPGPYSTKSSLKDARELATNIGIKLIIINITDTYNQYISELKRYFKGHEFNEAEENIQARIRANYLFALSNKFGYIVLATGNKSEAYTGYGTLYGDLAGGLAVIGDLYKTDVYKLAEYINNEEQIIHEDIIVKSPSAELRPDQKDSDDLPEYHILDEILKAYIDKGLKADEIIKEGHEAEIVHRVIKMVKKSEFKRKQAPPVLKVI